MSEYEPANGEANRRRHLVVSATIILLVFALGAGWWFAVVEPKPIRFQGRIRCNVAAIGGETTGIVLIDSAGKVWELSTEENRDLLSALMELDGKMASMWGFPQIKKGIEIKVRHIVSVIEVRSK